MLLLIDPRVKKFIKSRTDKQISKVLEYFDLFKEYGFLLDTRYLKKIKEKVWELRPGNIRIFIYEKKKHQRINKMERFSKEVITGFWS